MDAMVDDDPGGPDGAAEAALEALRPQRGWLDSLWAWCVERLARWP